MELTPLIEEVFTALMFTVKFTGVPIQPLTEVSVTDMLPPVLLKSTVIVFVPCPELMLAPEGTLQLYVDPIVFVTE